MRFESFSALRGCLKNSPWLSSDKTFVATLLSHLPILMLYLYLYKKYFVVQSKIKDFR